MRRIVYLLAPIPTLIIGVLLLAFFVLSILESHKQENEIRQSRLPIEYRDNTKLAAWHRHFDNGAETIFSRLESRRATISKMAKIHGVSKEVLMAVIAVETGGKNNVIGSAGERCLMQLMPSTRRYLVRTAQKEKGVRFSGDPEHVWECVWLGAYYIRRLQDRYNFGLEETLIAYNAGPGRVREWKRRGINIYDHLYLKKVTYVLGKLRTSTQVVSRK